MKPYGGYDSSDLRDRKERGVRIDEFQLIVQSLPIVEELNSSVPDYHDHEGSDDLPIVRKLGDFNGLEASVYSIRWDADENLSYEISIASTDALLESYYYTEEGILIYSRVVIRRQPPSGGEYDVRSNPAERMIYLPETYAEIILIAGEFEYSLRIGRGVDFMKTGNGLFNFLHQNIYEQRVRPLKSETIISQNLSHFTTTFHMMVHKYGDRYYQFLSDLIDPKIFEAFETLEERWESGDVL